jgi:hypothetical protein
MTIKIRQWTKGNRVGFEVDIRFTYPDGSPFRQRLKAPVESRLAAKCWAEAREAELLKAPSPKQRAQEQQEKKELPTLCDFGPRYIENRALADRLPAQITGGDGHKRTTLGPRVHAPPRR